MGQHCIRFFSREHYRQLSALWRSDYVTNFFQIDFQHLLVEEDKGVQRLILGRSSDAAVHGQMGEKLGNLCRIHLSGMTLPVKKNEPPYPATIGFFSSQTQMPETRFVTYLIEEFPLCHS